MPLDSKTAGVAASAEWWCLRPATWLAKQPPSRPPPCQGFVSTLASPCDVDLFLAASTSQSLPVSAVALTGVVLLTGSPGGSVRGCK